MLLPEAESIHVSSRARRVIRQVAVVVATGCLLGLVAMRVGGLM